ncbi:MAG: hypothetical protein ACREF6_09835, partial [Alphaproteobacteria bacterium]
MKRDDRPESGLSTVSRRAVLAGAAAAMLPLPAIGSRQALAAAKGKMVMTWHTAMAPRWLDPQEHDGTATPDNFLHALHDALIKNTGTSLYDHPALAERYEFAKDA